MRAPLSKVMSGRTPYLDALGAFAERAPARLTTPGHKGGRALPGSLPAVLRQAAALDLPLLIDGVDVTSAAPRALSPLHEAQQLAAEAWGAGRTWFLTGGATQANLAVCLALAMGGRRVVAQRTSHSSTFNGLALAGLETVSVMPHVDPILGLAHCVDPDLLRRALDAAPGAVAVLITSPTYYGSAADLAGLAAVAHERGALFVVDEAWGAHLRFSDRLPQDALAAGADLVVSSTHKHLGSLGGSAMLHRGRSAPAWVDSAIDRALELLTSTSPSSLLMASLDAARARAVLHGAQLIDDAIDELADVRAAIRAIGPYDVLDERLVGSHGAAGHDPLRLCIDVRGTGHSGVAIAAELAARDDVELELKTERVVVALFGLGESPARAAAPLIAALQRIALQARDGQSHPSVAPHRWVEPVRSLPSRAALLGTRRSVPIEVADGLVAAEALVPYPPGIPVVLPGERLDGQMLVALRASIRGGVTLRGASDPGLDRVEVVDLVTADRIADGRAVAAPAGAHAATRGPARAEVAA